MLNYTLKATTVKDLSVFNYSLYSCLSLNMLKYNHDSSAVIRLLKSLIDASDVVMEDLPYIISFSLTGLEFINIDRLNGWYISSIVGFSENNPDRKILNGYSRYSDTYHTLKQVESINDFIRHSIPAQAFFSDLISSNAPVDVFAQPNVKIPINMAVRNSVVTITPVSGFFNINKLNYDTLIGIKIFGKNIHNEPVSEIVYIEINMDTPSELEYSYIEHIMLVNATTSVNLKLSPYITGNNVIWDKLIVDRDGLEAYTAILNVNKEKKQLCFNYLNPDITLYPMEFEVLKTVNIALSPSQSIIDYYIDVPNRLLYVTANDTDELAEIEVSLNVYSLNIPRSPTKFLDSIKTKKQSIKIEYIEDCQNDKFIFWIFPSSQTNDVDMMSIYIDGVLWKENILLDLIRENIETNRIEIPFSLLTSEVTLVEFITYGAAGETDQPVILDRTRLLPIYIKDMNAIQVFKDGPEPGLYVAPSISSTDIPYNEHGAYGYGDGMYGGTTNTDRVFGYGGIFTKDTSNLFKLSSAGNVLIDGIKIIHVYDTFYYDDTNKMIITSDTITHVQSFDDADVMGIITETTNEFIADEYNSRILTVE